MRIVFLIVNHGETYEGAARPFLNLAKGSMNANKISIALFRSNQLPMQIDTDLRSSIMMAEDKNTLLNGVVEFDPDFVIGDDKPSSLQLLGHLRKIRGSVLSYSQILFGSHSISRYFDMSCVSLRDKIMFRSSQLIPFMILSSKYSKSLRSCHAVLANSKLTATMLHILYDVDTAGIVYPPVDTDVFRPTYREEEESDEVVLYLGSHAGDSRMIDLQAIVDEVTGKGYKINAIGNVSLASKLAEKYKGIIFHQRLKDEELAKLYSKSKVTICPQKWETFGYVPAESMACGTPVVAYNCMGSQETVLDNVTGRLANNREELLHQIDFILRQGISTFHQEELVNYVVRRFSIDSCTEQLTKLLENMVKD